MNANKYNYYITLINLCDSLDNADRLLTEIAEDKTISLAEYCDLYNLLMVKYHRFNEKLQVNQISLML